MKGGIGINITADALIQLNRFTKGEKYIIRKAKSRKKEVVFSGTFCCAYDFFYLFKDNKGRRECFLKVDYEIGEYIIERRRST